MFNALLLLTLVFNTLKDSYFEINFQFDRLLCKIIVLVSHFGVKIKSVYVETFCHMSIVLVTVIYQALVYEKQGCQGLTISHKIAVCDHIHVLKFWRM